MLGCLFLAQFVLLLRDPIPGESFRWYQTSARVENLGLVLALFILGAIWVCLKIGFPSNRLRLEKTMVKYDNFGEYNPIFKPFFGYSMMIKALHQLTSHLAPAAAMSGSALVIQPGQECRDGSKLKTQGTTGFGLRLIQY